MSSFGVDLGSTFGAVWIGTVAAVFLTGILTLQTGNYFRSFPKDHVLFKLFVAAIYLMDLAHMALSVGMVYFYIVVLFGNYIDGYKLTPIFIASNTLENIVTFGVQTFYCFRVFQVTRSPFIAVPCWLVSIARLGVSEWLVSLVFGIFGSQLLDDTNHAVHVQIVAALTLSAAADIVIAVCLCAGMLRIRGHGIDTTNKIIDKIIAFTIGSGLLTGIVAIIELILYLNLDTLIYLTLDIVVSKVYTNSFLASLNERSYFRAEMRRADWSTFTKRTTPHLSFQGTATVHDIELDRTAIRVEDIAVLSHENATTSDLKKASHDV